MPVPAILLLENEEPFHGVAAGAEGLARGAVVASAASAGQPDLLTDPAYGGKIVCFTYPHIGTAGVVPDDLQSGRVAARAVVARELGDFAANRLGVAPMTAWLAEHRVPAIVGVDTRSIAQIVARRGHIRAIAGTGVFADAAALAREFSSRPDAWREEPAGVAAPVEWTENAPDAPARTVVVYDFGVKRGFLRRLAGCGCRVRLVPSGYPAEKTLAENLLLRFRVARQPPGRAAGRDRPAGQGPAVGRGRRGRRARRRLRRADDGGRARPLRRAAGVPRGKSAGRDDGAGP